MISNLNVNICNFFVNSEWQIGKLIISRLDTVSYSNLALNKDLFPPHQYPVLQLVFYEGVTGQCRDGPNVEGHCHVVEEPQNIVSAQPHGKWSWGGWALKRVSATFQFMGRPFDGDIFYFQNFRTGQLCLS